MSNTEERCTLASKTRRAGLASSARVRLTGMVGAGLSLLGALVLPACSEDPQTPGGGEVCAPSVQIAPASGGDLLNRAYIASRDSGNVTIIDLNTLTIAGSIDTCSRGYHMVELSADFSTVYASNTEDNALDVLDAKSLNVTDHVAVAAHPTHLSLSRNGKILSVVGEGDNAVSFVDPVRKVELKRLPGFFVPHFVRYSLDDKYGYVANLGAHHLTRVNMETLEVDQTIPLDGFEGAPVETKGEGGFADAQIDQNGVLWAAHGDTGKVLVYDTKAHSKIEELEAGNKPWIVYAEHPFAEVDAHIVPNHGDLNVALLQRSIATPNKIVTGERESYGVNYSPLAPEKAFVMNRMRKEIAVLDTMTKKITTTIPVGGNTETASTTADGKYVVATVSDANRVVIIDAKSNEIVKTFDGIGSYPWTVTIPLGQNYCH